MHSADYVCQGHGDPCVILTVAVVTLQWASGPQREGPRVCPAQLPECPSGVGLILRSNCTYNSAIQAGPLGRERELWLDVLGGRQWGIRHFRGPASVPCPPRHPPVGVTQ